MAEEAEIPETERVERLTVSPEKHVVDFGEQDGLEALSDIAPGCGDGNISSELLVAENSQNAVDGSMLDESSCVSDPAEISCPGANNVTDILSMSVDSGSISTNMNSFEPVNAQDADSFIGHSMEVVENDVDLPFVGGGNSADVVSLETSKMSQSFEKVGRDKADFLQPESSLHSAEEPTDSNNVDISVVGIGSDSPMPSAAGSTETAELYRNALSQPESTGKGKFFYRCRFFPIFK